MRVGLLTGGGDCPGLNAVIRAVVRKGERTYGDELVGFQDGWRGVVEDVVLPLDVERCRGILPRGGTILGTSRTNPYTLDGGVEAVRATLEGRGIDALVAIGGEDTLGVAHRLSGEGVAVVGVPKTIDNDLSATEVTFGFQTAVQIACDAIDRLHTTAESHDRVMVVEVMGRHAGWIATHAGIAGGAAEILVPEEPFDIEAVCARLVRRHRNARYASIVVVAEGAVPAAGTLGGGGPGAGEGGGPGGGDGSDGDGGSGGGGGSGGAVTRTGERDAFGHAVLGGIGTVLAEEIRRRTGFDTRVTILGHVQRGGTPTAFDRVLATRFGIAAIEAVHEDGFGTMVALQAGSIVRVPLADAVTELKTVDRQLYEHVAAPFFG